MAAVCHYRIICSAFVVGENHESAPSSHELHLNFARLMRVFTSQRTAHVSLLHVTHWLQLLKNSHVGIWILLRRLIFEDFLFVCLFVLLLSLQSQSIGMNPLYVMVPCTLSASFAFMLPVATPPNAIVFSYGYLKVADMVSLFMCFVGCFSLVSLLVFFVFFTEICFFIQFADHNLY